MPAMHLTQLLILPVLPPDVCRVISLAGLASLTDQCRKQETDYLSAGLGAVDLSSVGTFVNSEEMVYNCGIYYSLQW